MEKISIKGVSIEDISKVFHDNHKTQIIETSIDEIKVIILEAVGNTKVFACIEKTGNHESSNLASIQRQPQLKNGIPKNLEIIGVFFNGAYNHGEFKTERYHYVKEVLPEFRNKGIAKLLMEIKECVDCSLSKDYSAKPSNMRFLMNNGYWPTNVVFDLEGGGTKIEKINDEMLGTLMHYLNESKEEGHDESFPLTIGFTKKDWQNC